MIDRRLREAFQRSEPVVDTEIDATLATVARAAGHRRLVRRVALATSVVGAIALAMALSPSILDAIRSTPQPAVPAAPRSIAERYTAQIPGTQREIARDDLGGAWTMTIGENGSITLQGPPPLARILQGSATTTGDYRYDGGVFRTNVFANGPCPNTIGAYVVHLTGSGLRFSPTGSGDPCALRLAVFTSAEWSIAP
jgi:hypothetical protein